MPQLFRKLKSKWDELKQGAQQSQAQSLCPNCSESLLVKSTWDELKQGAQQSQVIYTWLWEDLDSACPLCLIIYHECEDVLSGRGWKVDFIMSVRATLPAHHPFFAPEG